MDGTVFYPVGIALTLAALVVSYVGIKGKSSFPPSGRAFAAVIAPFAVLVIATAAYGVANAREEQEHREEELSEEHAGAEDEVPLTPGGAPSGEQPEQTPGPPGGEEQEAPAAGSAETLDIASPADGGLSFEPDGLQAQAGTITLAYENPSPVIHNVAIEGAEGETIAQSENITDGSVELSEELAPGEYVFYCSIAGHREGGMEGTLTVE